MTASKRPLFAALLLYFALTAALIARVPLLLSPDEAAHFQYVQHIAQTGTLPVFRGAAPPAPGYEFHQPPLYYLLCAPGWRLLGAGVQNYSCRAVSMLCGLGAIWVIWSAAQLLFPHKPRVWALAALFAALFPLHQAVGAGANNDSLAGLLAAALFFLMARMSRGLSRRDAWGFGLVAGLAILTKSTLLVLVFSGFIALVWSSKKPNSQIAMLPALGLALLLTSLVGGPWLARNQLLYGDPLALGAFSGAAKAVAPGYPLFLQLYGMSFLAYLRGLVWITFMSMWGFFGGVNAAFNATLPLNKSGPTMPKLELLPLVISCLSLPLLAAWGWSRGAKDTAEEAETPSNRDVWKWWILGAVLLILAWAQFAFQFFAGAQARYLHPILLPFCVFIAVGFERLFPRRALGGAGALFGATLLTLTLLNVVWWKTFTD